MTDTNTQLTLPAALGRDAHAEEVARGERFEFGKNWARFLAVIDEERIGQAEGIPGEMLGRDTGRHPVPGHGIGQRPLQPRRTGGWAPTFIHSTTILTCRVHPRAQDAILPGGDQLARRARLGSRRGLHRPLGCSTSSIHGACCTTRGRCGRRSTTPSAPVGDGGGLFIAIYNDMGSQSTRWKHSSTPMRDSAGPCRARSRSPSARRKN